MIRQAFTIGAMRIARWASGFISRLLAGVEARVRRLSASVENAAVDRINWSAWDSWDDAPADVRRLAPPDVVDRWLGEHVRRGAQDGCKLAAAVDRAGEVSTCMILTDRGCVPAFSREGEWMGQQTA